MAVKLVRLKKINKRTGNLAQTYDYGGQIFRQGRWYKVSDETAAKLAKLTVDPYDSTSAPVFDIFEAKDALKIDRQEKKADLKKKGIHIPKAEAEEPEDVEGLTGIKEKPDVIRAQEVESLADMIPDEDGLDELPADDDPDDDDDDDQGDEGGKETGDLTTKDLPKTGKAKTATKRRKKK